MLRGASRASRALQLVQQSTPLPKRQTKLVKTTDEIHAKKVCCVDFGTHEAVLAQILCKWALCTKFALRGLLHADISAKDSFGVDFVCLFDRFHLPFGEGLVGLWTSCRTWEAPLSIYQNLSGKCP